MHFLSYKKVLKEWKVVALLTSIHVVDVQLLTNENELFLKS